MDNDITEKRGVRTTTAAIAFNQGIHIAREEVSRIMHIHDPDSFERRAPGAQRISRHPIIPIGIHERWAADGHDKLYRIGFPLYMITDWATGYILGAWIVPSNRVASVVTHLFLELVLKYKGMSCHLLFNSST